MASDLIGRTHELGVLAAALDTDAGARVAVVGEPGIGKSRLLAEYAAVAETRNALVLLGRAAEFERDLPFAVWVDALDDYLRSLEHEEVDALGGQDAVDELATMLPALTARSSPRAAAPLLDERHRLHSAVRTLLATLAARAPVLVLLDDMHWADAGSLDLLGSLLRRPPHGPVSLVVALRPHPASVRLSAALDRAERDGQLTRLPLTPLTAAECDALLGDRVPSGPAVPPQLRTELRRESGGNPFYLQALARSTQRGGTVPQSVTDAIAEELRLLPGPARQVLNAAAVVGEPFEPELVADTAGCGVDEVVQALDLLLEADLVRPTPVPRRFVMRHPLVRRAVYESVGGGWRLGAHARATRALRRRHAPLPILAHHVARSALPGDTEAVELLTRAARDVLARAPATAAGWFEIALALLDDGAAAGGARPRIAILEQLARARAATGRLSESRDALVAALDLVPAGSTAERGRLAAACAGVEHRLGRLDDAHRRLRAALDALPDGTSPERLSLLVELAADSFHRRAPDEMTAWATGGLEAAEALGDRPHAAAARALLALADVLRERSGPAREQAAAAGAAVDDLSDDELATRLDGVHYLNMAEMHTERFESLIAHAARAAEVARASGQGSLLGVLAQSRGFGAAVLGRLDEARRVLGTAVEGERLSGTPYSQVWVLVPAAIAATWAGDTGEAIRAAEESCTLMHRLDTNVITAYPSAVLGWARLEAGNPELAAGTLLDGCGGPELPLLWGFWRCLSLEVLTRAELGRGRPAAAAAAAGRAAAGAADLGLDLPTGWARRARAAVLLDAGKPADAAQLALESAADLARGGARVEEGRSRLLAGRALAAAGRREPAVAELRSAADLAERCAAAGLAAETSRELRRLGYRRRRSHGPAVGPATLSEREREVAGLVASGRTNAAIAHELHLSTKTVESHLRQVFAKLNVSSRVEVALAVRGPARSTDAVETPSDRR